MQILRKILDFYIYSSLHVGIAVFCLTQISFPKPTEYSYLVFFGTIIGYNFLKFFPWRKLHFSINSLQSRILIVNCFALIGFFYFFTKQNIEIQLKLFLAFLFVLLYPFVRKKGWLKLFFVAFVVSYVTVYIPHESNSEIKWHFIQRFLLLSSLMVPFEIIDSSTDAPSLQTLPQKFGIKRTKEVGYLLVGLYCLLSFYLQNSFYLFFMYAFPTVVAIYFSSTKRSWYYSSLWVESIPIFWWLILIFII